MMKGREKNRGEPGPDKESKIQEYLNRLDRLTDLLVRRLHLELQQHMVTGVTGSQFVVLKKIHEHGRVTVSEVAGDLSVSLSAITAQVDRMHRAGLVQRRRDEGDRRVVWLELTPEGKEAYNACQASRLKVMRKYFGQLDENELETLLDINERLLSIIESEPEGNK